MMQGGICPDEYFLNLFTHITLRVADSMSRPRKISRCDTHIGEHKGIKTMRSAQRASCECTTQQTTRNVFVTSPLNGSALPSPGTRSTSTISKAGPLFQTAGGRSLPLPLESHDSSTISSCPPSRRQTAQPHGTYRGARSNPAAAIKPHNFAGDYALPRVPARPLLSLPPGPAWNQTLVRQILNECRSFREEHTQLS